MRWFDRLWQRLTAPETVPHIARNARCRCGSGRKYKRCCLFKDEKRERELLDLKYYGHQGMGYSSGGGGSSGGSSGGGGGFSGGGGSFGGGGASGGW